MRNSTSLVLKLEAIQRCLINVQGAGIITICNTNILSSFLLSRLMASLQCHHPISEDFPIGRLPDSYRYCVHISMEPTLTQSAAEYLYLVDLLQPLWYPHFHTSFSFPFITLLQEGPCVSRVLLPPDIFLRCHYFVSGDGRQSLG